MFVNVFLPNFGISKVLCFLSLWFADVIAPLSNTFQFGFLFIVWLKKKKRNARVNFSFWGTQDKVRTTDLGDSCKYKPSYNTAGEWRNLLLEGHTPYSDSTVALWNGGLAEITLTVLLFVVMHMNRKNHLWCQAQEAYILSIMF